jgi:hypothetical protein
MQMLTAPRRCSSAKDSVERMSIKGEGRSAMEARLSGIP